MRKDPWLKSFDYFWFADDNMDLRLTDVNLFVTLFALSGALIGQPAVENSVWDSLTWPNPAWDCAFRFVPVVEVKLLL